MLPHEKRGLERGAAACFVILLLSALVAGAAACGEIPLRLKPGIDVDRVLFLGNSITWHGPAAEIGWAGDWGMAASAPERDYVHAVADGLAAASGKTPKVMVSNIAEFEKNHGTYEIARRLKPELEFRPTLVIVAIGENVATPRTAEARARFAASFSGLLRVVVGAGRPSLVVRGCFWPDAAKDEIMRRACLDAGGAFADIGRLGGDRSNRASSERRFENAGVGAHPGDKGMGAISDIIITSLTTGDLPGR